jgi:amino acid adenylation domain-containing protein
MSYSSSTAFDLQGQIHGDEGPRGQPWDGEFARAIAEYDAAPLPAVEHLALSLRIRGGVEIDRLERAVGSAFERHEALRARVASAARDTLEVGSSADQAIAISFGDVDEDGLEHARVALASARFEASQCLARAHVLCVTGQPRELIIVVHRAICDRRSLRLIAREIARSYAEPSSVQAIGEFRERLAQAHAWSTSQARAAALDYSRAQLAGELTTLEWPHEAPRPRVFAGHGETLFASLGADLSERLREFTSSRGVSLDELLFAAWLVVLGQYAYQTDLIVRVQNEVGAERVVGPFEQSCIVRVQLAHETTVSRALAEITRAYRDALRHSGIAPRELVDALKLQHDPSRTAPYQAAFAIEEGSFELAVSSALAFDVEEVVLPIARTDLTLRVQLGSTIRIGLEYNSQLWARPAMARALLGYEQALSALITASEDTAVGALNVLGEEERARALSLVNVTPCDFERRAHVRFEQQTSRAPDAVAVVMGKERLSYRELNARANRLARRLRREGVERESLVAVYCERSIDMLVAIVAVHKAGGAYVPLDPSHPLARTSAIMTDAGPRVLLTQSALADVHPSLDGARVVFVDDATLTQESSDDLNIELPANSLAYVIFTSGSTGKPKGVEIEQAALTNFLASMARWPGLRAHERILAVTTLAFDIAGLELWLPLTVGASIEIADRETCADATRLRQVLDDPAITLMQATPASWRMLIESGWGGRKTLRVLCGGEAFPPDLIAALLERAGEIWNMYGPTETTVWSTLQRLTRASAPVSIGSPIDNTSVYLLNPLLQPVPPGSVGEICIGGKGVARGYRNRPELTRERFVPDPFGHEPNARLYKTGDLGRMLPDGTITCLGRIDFQVKVRGFRIELGEIEAALIDCAEVRQAVVVAREDTPGNVRLVAYVVANDVVDDALPRSLRARLEQRLPAYMVPSVFVPLDALPLNPSGKVDRKALPVPSAVPSTAPGEGPRDDLEALLHDAWCHTLGLAAVGVEDSFFDLGGHSLLAVRLIRRIEELHGTSVTLGQLFQAPTIRQLAQSLRSKRTNSDAPEIVTLRRGSGSGSLFCVCGIALYQALARALPNDRTVLGVYVPAEGRILTEGNAVAEFSAPSIEELAASYVSAIRSAQPHGPYAVAGISFGGVVAYEAAQQLTDAGEKVELLVMLDPLLPGADGRGRWWRIAGHARDSLRSPALLQAWLKVALGRRFPRPMSKWSSDELIALRNAVHIVAMEHYVSHMRPYQGDAVIVGALDRTDYGGREVDPAVGWTRAIRGTLTVFGIQGGHLGILDLPNVAELAARLGRHMQTLEAARERPTNP